MFAGHPSQSLDKDERYTPQWVFSGLGLAFDLDPASPGEGGGDAVPVAADGLRRLANSGVHAGVLVRREVAA